jgi:Icc-related predicted phosphoesterase
LFVCGHVHEATGEAQLRDTQIINVARRFEVIDLETLMQPETRVLLQQLRTAYAQIKITRAGLFERLAHQGCEP